MVTHMKTTIEIAHDLLRRAKATAQRESTTLRALVEEGLRWALARRERPSRPARIKPVVVKGKGLRPEAQHLSWSQILELANERPGR